jgi:hypothetical protein
MGLAAGKSGSVGINIFPIFEQRLLIGSLDAAHDVALGRKNYLFAGSDSGGNSAAAIYSLIGTAKLNRIDPEA